MLCTIHKIQLEMKGSRCLDDKINQERTQLSEKKGDFAAL